MFSPRSDVVVHLSFEQRPIKRNKVEESGTKWNKVGQGGTKWQCLLDVENKPGTAEGGSARGGVPGGRV